MLGRATYINHDGKAIRLEESTHIWIRHLYEGRGVALEETACPIPLPLTQMPLTALVEWLRAHLQHNFIPALLVIGGFAMALHYRTIITKFLFCPIPLAFGRSSGTRKTTAMCCGLSMLGCHNSRLLSKASYKKYADLCTSSYLPLGVDDPKSKAAISDLTVSLFNGVEEGTVKRSWARDLSRWQ